MNLAYIHLLTNHLPILGSIFGVLLLFIAYFKPQLHTAFSAYLLLLISGVGGMLAYFTGEAAEEHVEQVGKGQTNSIVHYDRWCNCIYPFCIYRILRRTHQTWRINN